MDKEIIIERKKKIDIIEKLIELTYPKIFDNNDNLNYDYITEL